MLMEGYIQGARPQELIVSCRAARHALALGSTRQVVSAAPFAVVVSG